MRERRQESRKGSWEVGMVVGAGMGGWWVPGGLEAGWLGYWVRS